MSSPRSRQFMHQLLACLGFLCLTSTSLLAHHLPPGMEDVDEFEEEAAFMAGARHPLLGPDHWLLAMAVGVVAASAATHAARTSYAVCFLAAFIGGAAPALQGVVLHTSTCAFATGLLAVTIWPSGRFRMPALKLLLISMLALWQGNQHGIAWPLETGGAWYLTGLLGMTTALAGSGSVLTRIASSLVRVQVPASVTTH